MNTTIIPINQVYHELKQITKKVQKGSSFLVVKNSQPVFKIVPLDEINPKKKYNLQDFSKISFSGGKDLSQKNDTIVYL